MVPVAMRISKLATVSGRLATDPQFGRRYSIKDESFCTNTSTVLLRVLELASDSVSKVRQRSRN